MPSERDLLAQIWREVCRHIEIHASASTIAQALGTHMPLEVLLVRRYDGASRVLQTVAVSGPGAAAHHAAARTELAADQIRRLRAWVAANQVRSFAASPARRGLSFLVPPEISGPVLAGPLAGREGLAGCLILVAPSGTSWKARHMRLAAALLEPFSAALENDRRLHELASLREAAEAERRSLLTRIGRQEIREEIVGADAGLKNVMQRVALVAQLDVPVLILGETGTGKEVISRAIHSRSIRGAGPFIRVNCGAIPPELIDSQLFGHEKGSFTGAAEMRKGWFERADGGTLFLDEIGELPLAAQVRLLRVLQDGLVERVGGEHLIRVDVRIVAATHRELAEMVQRGTFREDLWYRVNVFPILLPRLRERLEDIPALARHFARRAANHFGLPYVEPSAEDLAALAQYAWPGNIRELGAVIDRAAILGDGKRLQVMQALGISRPPVESARAGSRGTTAIEVPAGRRDPAGATDAAAWDVAPLDVAMKEHIERALRATQGRIEGHGGAARLLAINPHTLRARMRKLKIDWSRFRASAGPLI
ncbi:MAG: sigma-54 interaction domain-containing protein [Pirellulaceae bacterium]